MPPLAKRGDVNPGVAVPPPSAVPEAGDVMFAARLLSVEPPLRGETPEVFHARVKRAWRRLMRAMED